MENELATNKAELTFIMAGLQIMPDDRRMQDSFYMDSKIKLYKLIHKYKTRVLFFSGDVHSAEFMTHPCSEEFVGYPLIELTASGLTEIYDPLEIVHEFIYDTILNNFLYTDMYNKYENRYYMDYQFGLIDIIWNSKNMMHTSISL